MVGSEPSPGQGAAADRWRDLLSGPSLPVVTVMCSGVLLYAMNLFFTAALLPIVVVDIGGQALYAWVTTAFVAVAILASLLVSLLLRWGGTARAYALAFLIFGAGTLASAASPGMAWLVASRALQGLGGGLLVGLGYAVIRTALPRRHWARGMGAVSAMWGLGLLFGPALGGAFASFGHWRWAYLVLTGAAVLLAAVGARAFPDQGERGRPQRLPLLPMLVLLAAIALLSLAAVVPPGWPMLLTLAAGLALLGLFLQVERRAERTLLPALAYRRGNPLKWTYLTVAALSAGVTLENFIPLFARDPGGVTPFLGGLLAASISAGWVLSQFFFVSVSPATARRVIRLGPLLMGVGVAAYGLLQAGDAGPGRMLAWFFALALAGTGVGMAWPSLGVAAMGSSADPADGGKAAAAISTTQLIAYSVVSAWIGTLMALGSASALQAARWAIAGTVMLCLVGVWTARRATAVA